jgi:drug/metabolite transporter (DMT)-like permease
VESQDPVYEESRFALHREAPCKDVSSRTPNRPASPGYAERAGGTGRFTLSASRLADFALLMVALIWGATFVMVKNAVATYPVLSFLALRFAFAALVLLPILLLRRSRMRENVSEAKADQPPTAISGAAKSPPGAMWEDAASLACHSERVNSPTFAAASHQRRISRWHFKCSASRQSGVIASGPAHSAAGRQASSDSTASCKEAISGPKGSVLRVDGATSPHLAILAAPLLMGLALFAGYALQTFGLRLTTPAKAGFITGLSVVIVPVVSTLLLRQRLSRGVWLGVGLATAGLALLSLQVADPIRVADPVRTGLTVSPGDLLVLGCAVAFACQILLTGRFAPHWDPLLLTFGQIVVVAVIAGLAALLLESTPAPGGAVLFAAAFTGILATSLAFGIQTVAQRFTSPTRTALVFSTEPVFAALFSFLLIGEVLGPRQLVGCALILAGMITAESLRTGSAAA